MTSYSWAEIILIPVATVLVWRALDMDRRLESTYDAILRFLRLT